MFKYQFRWDVVSGSFDFLLSGFQMTLIISAITLVLAMIAGLIIAMLDMSKFPPARWLGVGIIAIALADSALVVSDLLQRPNNALNAAHPVAGLPQLQDAVFGSAVMGYGDLFVAAALGALLAVSAQGSLQLRGAALAASLAVAFDLLFFLVDELPATVPVALTVLILLATGRLRIPRGSSLSAAGSRGAPDRGPPRRAAPPAPARPSGPLPGSAASAAPELSPPARPTAP